MKHERSEDRQASRWERGVQSATCGAMRAGMHYIEFRLTSYSGNDLWLGISNREGDVLKAPKSWRHDFSFACELHNPNRCQHGWFGVNLRTGLLHRSADEQERDDWGDEDGQNAHFNFFQDATHRWVEDDWERPSEGDTIGLLVNLGCSDCREICRSCDYSKGCAECGVSHGALLNDDVSKMACACAGASSFGSMSVFRNGAKLGVAFRCPAELFYDKLCG